ncbi:paraquat-inducible protein A [Algibacillus agarilyticus]|uniref:paraquat-inducible protein A n=1 Tax=Algibacillus agarilyticus TaxID=2234133 RepID=UPI000DD08436|nr:paraquat-inducible protein A [Algibacillus agarilyticus]
MDDKIACLECDLLIAPPILNAKQSAYCPRCHALITAKSYNNLQYSLAFALSGLLLMLVANFFPFLIFDSQGQILNMNLWQSAWTLYQYEEHFLAFLTAVFIIGLPFLLCFTLVYLLFPMIFLRKLWFSGQTVARVFFEVRIWSMSEVFLLGVLVSLTKIMTMADVRVGISFWAYVLFVFCLSAALANLDRYRFWHYTQRIINLQRGHHVS